KRTLESDQPRPINLNLISANPVFCHAPIPIDDFGGANQHFLRIAAAKSASATEGSGIQYGDLLSRLAATHGSSRGRRTSPDPDNIVFRRHAFDRSTWTAKRVDASKCSWSPLLTRLLGLFGLEAGLLDCLSDLGLRYLAVFI